MNGLAFSYYTALRWSRLALGCTALKQDHDLIVLQLALLCPEQNALQATDTTAQPCEKSLAKRPLPFRAEIGRRHSCSSSPLARMPRGWIVGPGGYRTPSASAVRGPRFTPRPRRRLVAFSVMSWSACAALGP
jgi:hypothetical protein